MEFSTHPDGWLIVPELGPRERLQQAKLLLQDLQGWSGEIPTGMVHSGEYKVRENWFQSVRTTLNGVILILGDDSLRADVESVFSAFNKRHISIGVLTLSSEIEAVDSLIQRALQKIDSAK